jgi:hypothetical protein
MLTKARLRLGNERKVEEAKAILLRAQELEESGNETRGGPSNSRAHAALGDVILHRANFLFADEQEHFEEGTQVLRGWKPTTINLAETSQMERRTLTYIKTALAARMTKQGKYEDAMKELERLIEESQPFPGDLVLKKSTLSASSPALPPPILLKHSNTCNWKSGPP